MVEGHPLGRRRPVPNPLQQVGGKGGVAAQQPLLQEGLDLNLCDDLCPRVKVNDLLGWMILGVDGQPASDTTDTRHLRHPIFASRFLAKVPHLGYPERRDADLSFAKPRFCRALVLKKLMQSEK